MKKLLLAGFLALSGAASLTGCVVARTEGHAVVADAPADNHLRILVATSAGLRDDKHLATLLPVLVTRLPQDFKHNGVEASATLLGFDTAVPLPADVRTLVISPTDAGTRGGASWLDFSVTLNDAKRGVLWQGMVRLSTGGGGSYDAGAVDRAAVPLLEQLRDARLIDIAAQRPGTP